jgi:DivIVA domain-containing protein
MMWLFAILIVLALAGVAVLAAGRGTPMAEVYDDRPDARVPADRSLSGDDLRRVRFSLALRGYRMSEVDALLDRVAAQLEADGVAERADESEQPSTREGRGDEPTD